MAEDKACFVRSRSHAKTLRLVSCGMSLSERGSLVRAPIGGAKFGLGISLRAAIVTVIASSIDFITRVLELLAFRGELFQLDAAALG